MQPITGFHLNIKYNECSVVDSHFLVQPRTIISRRKFSELSQSEFPVVGEMIFFRGWYERPI